MVPLSELQMDVLVEALNIGMGSAASSLSDMLGSPVNLSVPQLDFLDREKVVSVLNETGCDRVCGVSQQFQGSFSGESMLLFPVEKSLELVHLLLQDTVPIDGLTEFEEEALSEIGNIILNAVIGCLADLFGQEIGTGLPVFKQGSFNQVLSHNSEVQGDAPFLLLRVDFNVESNSIKGYVVFTLNLSSLDDLIQGLDEYIHRISKMGA